MNYQRILNLNVYALADKEADLPKKRRQIFLDDIHSTTLDPKLTGIPRGRLESEVSFEHQDSAKRAFDDPRRRGKFATTSKPDAQSRTWRRGERESRAQDTRPNGDLTESDLRRRLADVANPSERTIKPVSQQQSNSRTPAHVAPGEAVGLGKGLLGSFILQII